MMGGRSIASLDEATQKNANISRATDGPNNLFLTNGSRKIFVFVCHRYSNT
jgi:hypothetical protein